MTRPDPSAIPDTPMETARRGVILVRFSALGDCVLLCPLAERLKASGCGEVIVVTKRQFAELFASADGVDRVVAYQPGSGIGGLARLADGLRDTGYPVIDAHATFRSRMFCRRLARPAARFDKRYAARLGLIVFKREATIPPMLDQYGALAGALGVDGLGLRPGGITVPPSAKQTADAALGGDASGRWIAVAPGSRWPSKMWPAERFAELAARFSRKGFRIVALGDDPERKAVETVVAGAGDDAVAHTGSGGIMVSAALIARCALLIGNDSGLIHLSEAVGVPVVSIYGPTVEDFGYYPSLAQSRTVEHELSCRPCSRNGATPCLRGTHECMTAIDVDLVETAVTDLLEGRGRPRYRTGPR